MKALLQKLLKSSAYAAAALVIVLAVAVGIFRLMLPRLPEYQEEIKAWASGAIGMRVEFSGMNARWRLSGPELIFFDAELAHEDADEIFLAAKEVSIGVGLLRLLQDRELVVDRILIRETDIDLRQDDAGVWMLQGTPFDLVAGGRTAAAKNAGSVEVIGQDIHVSYEHPASGQLLAFTVTSISLQRDGEQIEISASLGLPEAFGDSLEVTADQNMDVNEPGGWRLFVEGSGLDIAGWSRLQPSGFPEIDSGDAELSLWIDYANGVVQRATANVLIDDLRSRRSTAPAPFGVQGSLEFSREPNGFLLAANRFRLTTVDGDWPQSSLLLRVATDDDGGLTTLRASASYLDLDDLRYVDAWIPETQLATLQNIRPSGNLRDLSIELSEMQGDAPQFDIAADLDAAGIAAFDGRPGVRDFSGSIRADRDGGRIEIASTDLELDTGSLLADTVSFDDAMGTVIWRRNSSGVIVLSDSVRLRNADFDSQSSLQISIPANGESPFVDVESDWSVNDVSAISRYLPVRIRQLPIGEWLEMAPVAGIVRRGTLQLNGPLDAFPFDDGSGSLRVRADLEDLILQYSESWPAPQFSHVAVELDNMHLVSQRNQATVLGTSVENATVRITDLREPVIEIEAFATGTLESLRRFGAASPINAVLGGQLDRVQVDGNASLALTVSYPLKDKLNYDFSARIQTSNGSVRVAGFPPPVSELNGIVAVGKNSISAESLFGRFLGNPVDFELDRAADPEAPHSVLLNATGSTTARALADEFGMPLNDLATGRFDYTASVRFPNTQVESPGILQAVVQSDLRGLGIDLPTPIAKDETEVRPLAMKIEFPEDGRIDSSGGLGENFRWVSRFLKTGEQWDFDRGMLAVGGDYPAMPDTRGLHITGQTPEVRVHDWLALARRNGQENSVSERVRTIDLAVENLYVIGQHLTGHRVRLNRGGNDWSIQVDGLQAEGTVTVPYDFSGPRPLVVDMERLYLPGSDEPRAADEIAVDPRTLPDISIKVQDFALGDRFFGQLAVDLEQTDNGLESSDLQTSDATFALTGAAGWIVDIYEASGQRTYLNAHLESTNIAETARRLNYQPGLDGDDLEVDIEVSWAGGPSQDFLASLNGSVQARLGEGQLEDVDPGAGRVFGLMSVVALPRRLSLDFRDVFDSGFSFDEITGRFRLVNGDAYTCDLTLTSPAADVGIVGRAGLVSRDYTQTAVVSANFGNTLPVAGYVVAGPQVAAALLIFSQIFKKPLQEMGQVYYGIDGSWDDPLIDNADAARFASNSSLAGCITPAE